LIFFWFINLFKEVKRGLLSLTSQNHDTTHVQKAIEFIAFFAAKQGFSTNSSKVNELPKGSRFRPAAAGLNCNV